MDGRVNEGRRETRGSLQGREGAPHRPPRMPRHAAPRVHAWGMHAIVRLFALRLVARRRHAPRGWLRMWDGIGYEKPSTREDWWPRCGNGRGGGGGGAVVCAGVGGAAGADGGRGGSWMCACTLST
eukprot:353876-Chlamydomonas_euryale.AAC.6